jgi:hypothetical protein
MVVLRCNIIRTLTLTVRRDVPTMSTSLLLDSNQDTSRCFDMLSALPVELSLHILCFIQELRTLGRLSMVCKAWNILVQDESIWRLQSERFGYVPVNRGEVDEVWNGWREYFIKLYTSGRVCHIANSSEVSRSVS